MEPSENQCGNCRFDLGKLDLTILYARKGMETRKLHCPICRSDQIKLSALDRVFPRPSTGRWVRWREGGGSAPSNNVLTIGKLKLRVETEIESLSKEQICFKTVPVFISGGAKVVPTLPVMPEFIDCLDPVEVRRARSDPSRFGRIIQEKGRAKYQCLLPLRGLKPTEWPTHECELLPSNPYAPGGDTEALAFRGVSVRIWPNLKSPTRAWRYYLASVAAANEDGMNLFAQGRTFKARMLVPKNESGGPASDTELDVIPLDQEQGREGEGPPLGYVGASRQGRPAWVSVEFYHPSSAPGAPPEALGGGLLSLSPPLDRTPSDAWTLGIDFGTSNTVVAFKRKDGTVHCVAPERGATRAATTQYLVHGGPQTLHKGLDLWPGGEWSGPHYDLLPSELGSVRRWTDLASESAIEALAFGKDFGVPLRGATSTTSSEHVVSEFKWLRAVAKDKSALGQPKLVQALQSRFLEGAMLMTAAAILAEDEANAPSTVNVEYSFPLAFDDQDLRTLRQAAESAGSQLRALTGATYMFPTTPRVDEAQAAAGDTPADKMFRVYCDLGGGSLEVLVDDLLARRNAQGHEGLHPHVFSTSIFFGGSVYLRSLVGAAESDRRGICVMPTWASYTRLASVVRQMPSGKALIDAPHVISESRKSAAERRARVYIGYIIELIARILAGVCLEHGRGTGSAGTLDLSRNRLFTLSTSGGVARWILGTQKGPGQKRTVDFSIVLLGNGWGFADIVRDGMKSVEQMIAQRVYARMMDLIRETPVAKDITDGEYALLDSRLSMDVSYVPLKDGVHRKAAVALGLLGAHHTTEDAQRFFQKRAPERHGVLGFDVWLNDAGRKVSWVRPFGQPSEDDPHLMHSATRSPAQSPHQNPHQNPPQSPITSTQTAPTYTPPLAPQAQQPFAQPTYGAPALAPAAQVPLEMMVFGMVQQWPQLAAHAAQMGMSPGDFAGRQLWIQLTQSAALQGLSPPQLLASQRWQQMQQQIATPGAPPEYLAWLGQSQMQALHASAMQRGMTPEALLAEQRWSQLLSQLPR